MKIIINSKWSTRYPSTPSHLYSVFPSCCRSLSASGTLATSIFPELHMMSCRKPSKAELRWTEQTHFWVSTQGPDQIWRPQRSLCHSSSAAGSLMKSEKIPRRMGTGSSSGTSLTPASSIRVAHTLIIPISRRRLKVLIRLFPTSSTGWLARETTRSHLCIRKWWRATQLRIRPSQSLSVSWFTMWATCTSLCTQSRESTLPTLRATKEETWWSSQWLTTQTTFIQFGTPWLFRKHLASYYPSTRLPGKLLARKLKIWGLPKLLMILIGKTPLPSKHGSKKA